MTNTGYQQATIAYCVSRPGDLPLDINGDLCSLSGKRQAIMLLRGEENPDPSKYEVYKTFEAGQQIDGLDTRIYNPEACPIVVNEDFSSNKSSLLYGVSDGNGFDIKDTIEITSSVDNLYRDYQVTSKPGWLTAMIGATNGRTNTLNLTIQRNRTEDDKRESVLTLTQNGTGKKIDIPVVQSGRLTEGTPTEYPYVNEELILDKNSTYVQLGEQIWSRELFTELGLTGWPAVTFGMRIDEARNNDTSTKDNIGNARLDKWYADYNASKNFFPSGIIPTVDEFHSIAGMRYNKPGILAVRNAIYTFYNEADDAARDRYKHHLPLDDDYLEFGGFLVAHNWNGLEDIPPIKEFYGFYIYTDSTGSKLYGNKEGWMTTQQYTTGRITPRTMSYYGCLFGEAQIIGYNLETDKWYTLVSANDYTEQNPLTNITFEVPADIREVQCSHFPQSGLEYKLYWEEDIVTSNESRLATIMKHRLDTTVNGYDDVRLGYPERWQWGSPTVTNGSVSNPIIIDGNAHANASRNKTYYQSVSAPGFKNKRFKTIYLPYDNTNGTSDHTITINYGVYNPGFDRDPELLNLVPMATYTAIKGTKGVAEITEFLVEPFIPDRVNNGEMTMIISVDTKENILCSTDTNSIVKYIYSWDNYMGWKNTNTNLAMSIEFESTLTYGTDKYAFGAGMTGRYQIYNYDNDGGNLNELFDRNFFWPHTQSNEDNYLIDIYMHSKDNYSYGAGIPAYGPGWWKWNDGNFGGFGEAIRTIRYRNLPYDIYDNGTEIIRVNAGDTIPSGYTLVPKGALRGAWFGNPDLTRDQLVTVESYVTGRLLAESWTNMGGIG